MSMMPVIRQETRMLMAQFRRNVTNSTLGSAMASRVNSAVEQNQNHPSGQQQRNLQSVSIGSSSAPSFHPAIVSSVLGQSSLEQQGGDHLFERTIASPEQAATPSASAVRDAAVLKNGKQVEVGFENGDRYIFHTSWLKDSAADNFGASFNRNCPHALDSARGSAATEAVVGESGSQLRLSFDVDGVEFDHEFDTRWLHAFAPYVAQPLNGVAKEVVSHAPLLSDLTVSAHKTPAGQWRSDKKIASFNCDELADDLDLQLQFLEVMATDGAAVLHDVPAPADLSSDSIGESLETVVNQVVGAMYQPPRRKTNYGIMRADMSALNIGKEEALADYNFKNPLSMHTDHAIYEETPGYLQFNWQAQASVTTKAVNGITVAEYIRATNPRAFHLLSTIHVTHAVRTNHYTFDGDYANSPGKYHSGTFEQMHTHPIIKLDADGDVVQVIHNELKRGVSAIPFDLYDEFNEAYTLWRDLCEDPRFTVEVDWPEHSCVVLNNHFVLHGRATPIPGDQTERIMVWGYTRKDITENRYRLLKQRQLEVEQGISDDATRNIPNQVLQALQVE